MDQINSSNENVESPGMSSAIIRLLVISIVISVCSFGIISISQCSGFFCINPFTFLEKYGIIGLYNSIVLIPLAFWAGRHEVVRPNKILLMVLIFITLLPPATMSYSLIKSRIEIKHFNQQAVQREKESSNQQADMIALAKQANFGIKTGEVKLEKVQDKKFIDVTTGDVYNFNLINIPIEFSNLPDEITNFYVSFDQIKLMDGRTIHFSEISGSDSNIDFWLTGWINARKVNNVWVYYVNDFGNSKEVTSLSSKEITTLSSMNLFLMTKQGENLPSIKSITLNLSIPGFLNREEATVQTTDVDLTKINQ